MTFLKDYDSSPNVRKIKSKVVIIDKTIYKIHVIYIKNLNNDNFKSMLNFEFRIL